MKRPACADERGAIMMIGLFIVVFAIGVLYLLVGTANAVLFRERLQDTADSAALSAAIMHARSMNLLVLINIVMAALVAILVTIKLIESVAIAGQIIAAAMSWITFGGSLVAIPPLHALQQQMSVAYETVKPPIDTVLEVLHDASDAIAGSAPAVAHAGASAELVQFGAGTVEEGLTLGTIDALPVEDDEYAVLCQHAAELPFEIASDALSNIPTLSSVIGLLKEAMGDMVGAFSEWFCGEGGASPPTFERTDLVPYPKLESAKACAAEVPQLDEGGALGIETKVPLGKLKSPACDRAAREAEDSTPDAATGNCKSGTDCSVSGPYEERARLARLDCSPTRRPRPQVYAFQTRLVRRKYVFDGSTWVRSDEPPEYAEPEYKAKDSNPPCGVANATFAETYNNVVRSSDDVAEVNPLCTDESKRLAELPTGTGIHGELKFAEGEVRVSEYTEVLHLLGCMIEETVPIQGKDDKAPGSSGSTRSPKRLIADLKLGQPSFQVWALALGNLQQQGERQIVDFARWNTKELGNPLQHLKSEAGYSLAQSEFYYEGEGGRAAWMWNMNWRARLRRIRIPEEHRDALVAKCETELGSGACEHVFESLERMGPLVAH